MPSPLELAITALTDPSVAPSDALRTLLVVARRIKADDLATWLNRELNGYEDQETVPEYRTAVLPIRARFVGPYQSSKTISLSLDDLPAELVPTNSGMSFRQPIAELVSLATAPGEGDPEIGLSLAWVQRWRHLADEGKAPRVEMHHLDVATLVAPKTLLLGMVDRVKSVALNLALDLESIDLDAGAANGPTVESAPELGRTVNIHLNSIYATQSSVVIGDQSAATTTLQAGDVAGLLSAARGLLDANGVDELEAALAADGGSAGTATIAFVDRLKIGAIGLAGGLTADLAHSGLHVLLKQVFPGFP